MKFLVVEENLGNADVIKSLLHTLFVGCIVDCESDLDALILSTEQYEYTAAIADVSLADTQGLETVRLLCESLPGTPIIVLTSLEDEIMAHAALELGAQDYLVKHDILTASALGGDRLYRSIHYSIQRQKSQQEVQLLVEELTKSQCLLEAKNVRLKQLCDTTQIFVDNVSHEFRTPLTVIKEYSALIRDGAVGTVNAQQVSMLNVIDDRTDDLNTMVDDLLDISRMEAGLLGLCRQERDFNEIVEYLMPSLRRKALVRNVQLEIEIPNPLPTVWCDGEKIGRVIINLVVNAIKFSGEPGIVRLWAIPDDERREIIVGVSDNGAGIPENKIGEIFNRFEQHVTNVRQSTKGFGLGLGIAKELVDLNLGHMEVESRNGNGSTFTFSIPYAEYDKVLLRQFNRLRAERPDSAEVSLVTLIAQPLGDNRDLGDLGLLFQQDLRNNDQLFRIADHRWLAVLAMSPFEFQAFKRRLEKEHREISRNRPKGSLPRFYAEYCGSWQLAHLQDEELLYEVRIRYEERELAHA